MDANIIIVTTIFALENGLHRSWLSDEFANALMSVCNIPEVKLVELHHIHKAAKKALKALDNIPAPSGWSGEHVALLGKVFYQEATK